MANIIDRKRKPPTQHLVGSGHTIYVNEDTAKRMNCVRLKRRAQRLLSSGVISGRIEEVWYEVQMDGLVTRVDEAGERKIVPDGHAEWKWVRNAQTWLWTRTYEGARAAGSPPPDLVAWEVAQPQHAKEG